MSPAAAELRSEEPTFQQMSPLAEPRKEPDAQPVLDDVFTDTVRLLAKATLEIAHFMCSPIRADRLLHDLLRFFAQSKPLKCIQTAEDAHVLLVARLATVAKTQGDAQGDDHMTACVYLDNRHTPTGS